MSDVSSRQGRIDRHLDAANSWTSIGSLASSILKVDDKYQGISADLK